MPTSGIFGNEEYRTLMQSPEAFSQNPVCVAGAREIVTEPRRLVRAATGVTIWMIVACELTKGASQFDGSEGRREPGAKRCQGVERLLLRGRQCRHLPR